MFQCIDHKATFRTRTDISARQSKSKGFVPLFVGVYKISELHDLHSVYKFMTLACVMALKKRRNKPSNGNYGDARNDNDGSHPTPALSKGIHGVGGIAQRKQFPIVYGILELKKRNLKTKRCLDSQPMQYLCFPSLFDSFDDCRNICLKMFIYADLYTESQRHFRNTNS